jgi:integrase/recombinase XerD
MTKVRGRVLRKVTYRAGTGVPRPICSVVNNEGNEEMTIEKMKRRPDKKDRVANVINEDLSRLIEPFLEDRQRKSDDHPIQKTTVRSYRLALKTFEAGLANAKNEDQLREGIRSTIDEKLDSNHKPKPMSASGVNVYIRGINTFFSWCKEQGVLQNDVKVKLRPTPKRKRPRTICRRNIDRLMSFRPSTNSQLRTKHMALLILDTGLRADECLLLQEDDIDWSGSRLWAYTKGHGDEKREVPLSSVGKKSLRSFLIEKAKRLKNKKGEVTTRTTNPHIFSTGKGAMVSYRNSLRDLKKLVQCIGVDWASWHTFRRTFATHYMQSGGLLTNLQEILGHAETRTTLLYLGSSIDEIVETHDEYSPLAA